MSEDEIVDLMARGILDDENASFEDYGPDTQEEARSWSRGALSALRAAGLEIVAKEAP